MEKERDGLLKDKEKELLAKQKVENTLNQTRINFGNYQNSTDLTIAEKDNKIKALDIKLENQDLVYSKNITRLEAEKSGLDSTIINKQIELENLTTEINKLNDDLLTVKDSNKFEIARLKSENKNYKKQRDGRPDISFSEYEELLAEQKRQKGEITELQKRPDINITETE